MTATGERQVPVRVRLRPMSTAQYQEWQARSIRSYADDLSKATGRPLEAELERARRQSLEAWWLAHRGQVRLRREQCWTGRYCCSRQAPVQTPVRPAKPVERSAGILFSWSPPRRSALRRSGISFGICFASDSDVEL